MNEPDAVLGGLKRRDGEPAFNEPWQAQALAMAHLLIGSGTVSAAEWAEALGEELRAPDLSGEPDDCEAYYMAVLNALEGLAIKGKSVSKSELAQRRHEWEHAYLDTPHGQPVLLVGRAGR